MSGSQVIGRLSISLSSITSDIAFDSFQHECTTLSDLG
jgi:hypothetical protein